MSERGYTSIHVISLFKDLTLGPGTAGTSQVIDLKNIANNGVFSLYVNQEAVGGTAGTTVLSYQGCSLRDGTYVTPSAATPIATLGTSGTANIISFQPPLMAFMKIIANQTGTSGVTKITAELMTQ
jgi:hypothetical protein